jgi:enoyl-CoA hydratase/carnithine racemase
MTLVSIATEPEGISWVNMRSEEDRNLLTPTFVDTLCNTLLQAGSDENCKVIILTGLSDIFAQGTADVKTSHQLTHIFTLLDVPAIAAVEGLALGIGRVLAEASDMLVLSDRAAIEAGTEISPPLFPAQQTEAMFTGSYSNENVMNKVFHANAILPHDQVKNQAFDLAMRIAENSQLAIKLLKKTLDKQNDNHNMMRIQA